MAANGVARNRKEHIMSNAYMTTLGATSQAIVDREGGEPAFVGTFAVAARKALREGAPSMAARWVLKATDPATGKPWTVRGLSDAAGVSKTHGARYVALGVALLSVKASARTTTLIDALDPFILTPTGIGARDLVSILSEVTEDEGYLSPQVVVAAAQRAWNDAQAAREAAQDDDTPETEPETDAPETEPETDTPEDDGTTDFHAMALAVAGPLGTIIKGMRDGDADAHVAWESLLPILSDGALVRKAARTA